MAAVKLFLWAAVGLHALISPFNEKKRDKIYLGNKGENVIDLSYTLSNESYTHPVHGKRLTLTKIPFDGDITLSMNRIEMAEHSGTHMDSISHIIKGGASVDEIPLSNLMGKGVLIDVSKNGMPLEGNVDITLEDFWAWEAEHGEICCGRDILFFHTGLGQFFETDINRYLGTSDVTDITSFQFPGLHPDLATFLVEQRSVRVIGTDTISTDTANRTDLMTHTILQGNGVVLLENVANLDKLVHHPKDFHVIILPIKMKYGTGIPTRIVAIKDD